MTNTKTRSRRKFTAEFKAKVAMEALQEKLTLCIIRLIPVQSVMGDFFVHVV